MVDSYQSKSISINLENIEEILKKIVEVISKPSKNILNKLNSSSTATEGNKKLELYNLVDFILNLLKEDDFFYDEYFDFCEIQDMIKYTLNRNVNIKSDLLFILILVLNFSKLVFYKMDLKENNKFSVEDYESVYNSFLTKFNESQTYFYENICDETLDDDLFIEYTNIIME